MLKLPKQTRGWMTAAGAALAILIAPQQALAHCDALDGPVIIEARQALENGDVTPVLKWVGAAEEAEIRAAFAQTVNVRKLDPAARELADRYFFETLVRVHRAGEGAPYTGLKPAGTVAPVVAMADRALDEGKIDTLAGKIAAHTEAGIRERFRHALETRKHAGDSVAAGREAVAAYVTYVHYVEGIANAVHAEAHHGSAAAAAHQH